MHSLVFGEHATLSSAQNGAEARTDGELHAHSHLEELGDWLAVSAGDAEWIRRNRA